MRIESPPHRSLSGLAVTEMFAGRQHLVVRVIVPEGQQLPGDFHVDVAGPEGHTASVSGTWPPSSLSDVIRSLPTPMLLPQARRFFPVSSFEVRVPIEGWVDGPATVTVRFGAATGTNPGPTDRITMNLDITPPLVPANTCSTTTPPGSQCVYYADGDERDCRAANICFPGAETARAQITLCGVTREYTLTPGTGAPEFGSSWMCTGPVDVTDLLPRVGACGNGACAAGENQSNCPRDCGNGNRGFRATVTDAAGNQTVSDGDPSSSMTNEPMSTPCFVPNRLTTVGYENATPLHIRTLSGTPMIISASGTSIVAQRHDGLRWRSETILTRPSRRFRGRIDGFTASNGTTHFCATNRLPGSTTAEPVEMDLFQPYGEVVVGTISPTGRVRAEALPGVAYAAGCGIWVDGSTTYLGVTGIRRVRGVDRPVPELRECSRSGTTFSCSRVRTFPSFSEGEPVGFEPDLALTPSEIHLVGRGIFGGRGSGLRVVETSIYDIVIPRASGPTRLRLPFQEAKAAPLLGGIPAVTAQGASPRVANVGNQAVVTWLQHDVANLFPAVWVTRLMGVRGASTPFAIAQIGTSTGPMAMLFPMPGRDAAVWAPPTYIDGMRTRVRTREIPPGYDVGSNGITLDVAYQRRSMGGRSQAEDRSSVWFDRIVIGTTPAPFAGARRRVDVETGHELNSSRYVSLYVNPARGFSAVNEPSVVYDVVRYRVPTATNILYADARTGQFVEAREDSQYGGTPGAAAARGPAAAREPMVPSDTCWARTTVLTDMSELESNLVPRPVLGAGPTPRNHISVGDTNFTATRSGTADQDWHRVATEAAECVLRADVAGRVRSFSPENARDHDRWVRERFIGNYLSLASSLREPGLAMLQSLRFEGNVLVPLGTLNIEVDGVAFTASVESGAREFDTFRATVTPATPNAPTVSFQQIGDGAFPDYRVTVSTSMQHRALGSGSPTSAQGETIVIRRTPLAEALGFPIDQVARRSWVDPRNGDYDDRLMACESREPCVPQRDVNGDSVLDGTCGRVSDCMEPGQSLLDGLFRDLTLRTGMPPMRANQSGVCVPNGPGGSELLGDVCNGPHASGTGTNRSYPSRTGACLPGTESLNNGTECGSCSASRVTDGPLRGPSGAPRLCQSDLDCRANMDCSGPAGCDFRTPGALCTRRAVAFDGIPAGQGFCAVPATNCDEAALFTRALPDWRPHTSVPSSTPTTRICRSLSPVNAAMDFEPASLECVATGCSACEGAWGPQTYCVNDGECPAEHRCVTDTANESVTTPACILRPVLGDGRFRDSRRTVFDGDRLTSDVPQAAPALQNIVTTIDNGVQQFSRTLATLVPGRYINSIADTASSRGQHVLIYGLEAHTTGAVIRYEVDRGAQPGAGDMLLDVFMDSLRVRVRAEGNWSLGASHGFDTDAVARVDVEGIRIRLRPFVSYDVNRQPHLGLRIIAGNLMRGLSRDGTRVVFAEGSNVTVESNSQTPVELVEFIRGLFFPISGIVDVAFEAYRRLLGVADAGPLPLGDTVTAIPFTDPLGPLLFGEELLPGFQPTNLEGVAIEFAQDFSVTTPTSTPIVPSLGLYGRRTPSSSLPTEVRLLPGRLGAACGFTMQPRGNCLETETDLTRCTPD